MIKSQDKQIAITIKDDVKQNNIFSSAANI